jgi:hypothetical protein
MSIGNSLAAKPRAILILQIVGFCIFVAAFFLPAVRDSGPISSSSNIFKGWECAKITITATFQMEAYESSGFLAIMSGWINPMIMLYLGFTFARKFARVRRILAIAILVCMLATWIYFAVERLVPMIGHFLWIAGALLILCAEAIDRERSGTAQPILKR